jgi:diguanylate cyclase (GGDEF)-like protein
MPSVLLREVHSSLGEHGVEELLRRADVPYTPDYLSDVGNWIWYREAVALLEAAADLTGNDRIGFRVGEGMLRQHAGTPVATLFRSLGSPQAIFEQLALAVTKFSTVTELEPLEVAPGRAVVRARARGGFKRHRHLCDWTMGMLSQPPAVFGLPSANVEESRCELRGDDHCLYTITWDAASAERSADPQHLVTALEAQLAAMRDRLDSVYATAKDLIALDDLDAALGRITERAATAVRAPKYLLVVQTSAGEPLSVHHRGWADEDPAAVAEALFEHGDDGRDPSRLIAPVASTRRHYGYLMATSSTGAFFPHERDLLTVYAGYAATVLDTATALDDARREGDRSRALLGLSRALAAATTSDEVAERLIAALPAVIDCDQADLFLWDEAEGAMTCRAATEASPERAAYLAELCVRPSDTPHLVRQLEEADPTPLFFEPGMPDEFVVQTLRDQGNDAAVIAPIVHHGRFYGSLNVSVSERPERLRRSQDLLDRLAGVAAQAATALDNARLIETMDHQARHDNLTGLLGHRSFHESLNVLTSDTGAAFTLAMIDIDDFKAINDRLGHPVGDEALVQVAEALRGSVRDHDAVFRVGGEEFGVLLPEVTALETLPIADRLRRAVASIAFATPLRVSVGLATWPADAADGQALIERADAALYAAKHAGKDCIRLTGSYAA